MSRQLSPEFQTAVEDSKKLTEKPSNDDLLVLYALYKQATQKPPIESAEAPTMFDLKGKAKLKAWRKIVDEGVTPDDAETKYVAVVEKMKERYGYDANKKPEAVGSS